MARQVRGQRLTLDGEVESDAVGSPTSGSWPRPLHAAIAPRAARVPAIWRAPTGHIHGDAHWCTTNTSCVRASNAKLETYVETLRLERGFRNAQPETLILLYPTKRGNVFFTDPSHFLKTYVRSGLPSSILDLAAAIAPHTSKHLVPKANLMTIVTKKAGSDGYCQHECESGAMVIFRGPNGTCPIQVGQVLRVVREDVGNTMVVIAPWWPVANPSKYGDKVNLYGKWSQGAKPVSGTGKRARQVPYMAIALADLLVWPVTMEETDGGARIPFTAFHYLRSMHDIDLSHHQYSFSTRGAKFYNEVAKTVAQAVRESQM